MSSNPVHGEVYSIQHYVVNFVSDMRQVGVFLRVLRFPPPIKQTATIYLNIVERGVKHHKPNQTKMCGLGMKMLLLFIYMIKRE